MDVSVTIVGWNRSDLLASCLRSVFATPRSVDYEVIVVDNASQDDSVAMVRAAFPQATLLASARNLGFARAQNQAIGVARGRYVLMLNPDATIRPDTIPTLLRLMARHPTVGALGCAEDRQRGLGTATSGAFLDYPSLARTSGENLWAALRPPRTVDLRWLLDPVRRWMGEELREVDVLEVAWCVGALLFVRREALAQVGGFDEQFFLFDEDLDLCRRMREAGWRIAFTTETRFSHVGGASSALRDDIGRIPGQSRRWYFQKHHGRVAAALFHLQHVILHQGLLAWRRRLGGWAAGSGGRVVEVAHDGERLGRRREHEPASLGTAQD
jgi:GT2 family glycosyltransferase